MKISYHVFDSPYGKVFTPLIDIRLKNPKTNDITPRYPSLVDSGATSCVFHAPLGELININITKGKEMPLKGVMEGVGVQYLHKVVIVVENINIDFEVEAGFTYEFGKNISNMFPYGILGQKGFFDHFKISFDLNHKIFEIK